MTRDSRSGAPHPGSHDEDDLDLFFAAARRAAPVPSPDLQRRVLAAADGLAGPRPQTPVAPAAVPGRARRGRSAGSGWLAEVWASMGGWSGGSGLAAATVAGLAVGFGAPGAVPVVGLPAAAVATADAADAAVDAEFMTWLWPGVGTVMDDLSAGLVSADEG
jgi:hypothetical protein